MSDELLSQIKVLRERVAELETALATGTDPLLKAMGERAGQMLHVVSPDGRLLATGRPSEGFGSVIGRSVYDFVTAESVPIVREAYARACTTQQVVAYESVGYGEDGSPDHTYLTRVYPIVTDGVVTAMVVVPTDITERVKLERALSEQTETLRLVIAASRMGLWRWDLATGAITWDDGLCAIFGVTETPADYAAYMELLYPDDRALVSRAIEDAMATGVYRPFEHRIRPDAHGVVRWVLAVGSVIKDDSGKVIQIIGGGMDITEQKQMAAQQQRAARVESIGQLTAGIAHNFNNLLAAIVPNAEMLLSTSTVAQRDAVTAILDASLQARDLVRNLLSLTQRDDTRSRAPAHPRDVVERVISICRVTFPREVELRHVIEPDLPHVAMNAGDLEQVLMNLLFNARDALENSTRAERQVVVDARRGSGESAPVVELVVRDNGVGMCPQVRARVFEPFFTTKPPHKGSGLGLANVAARVRDVGGSIECESTLGEGTSLRMRLPWGAAPVAREAESPTKHAQAPTGRILLVDDEPLVRTVIRRLLERDQHRVVEATSAAQARQLLQEPTPIDLVILDQSMPHETGLQALPSLRQLTKAPVILFTGMAPDEPLPVDAVLDKPARPDELQRVVSAMLQRYRP